MLWAAAGLNQSQRQPNLAGACALPQDQRHRLTNRPVLLIDDVMTTGATLYEVAKTRHRTSLWAGLGACFTPWAVTSFIQR